MDYIQKLKRTVVASGSCLCVGLDPDISKIPASLKQTCSDPDERVSIFLKKVIDLTTESCAAFKPNMGFFEALGKNGLRIFKEIVDYIPGDKIIIADAKRGDISSTAEHYAKAYFKVFNVDALTINPLMGFESLDPFLNDPSKGIYTLALTSNPGANDFLLQPFPGAQTMGAHIGKKLHELQKASKTHLGMVVGATNTDNIAGVINTHPTGSLLIPGIGTQGGSIDNLAGVLENHRGIPLVNSSRSILYAGAGPDNWQDAVRNRAAELKDNLGPITRNYV